jgi:hypothetical protein
MALPSNALISLAELKDYIPVTGTGKDTELERTIGRASSVVEGQGVRYRRLVYRGPIEDDDNIMAVATLANGTSAPAIAGQPNSAGRTLVVKRVGGRELTRGTLTVTGTVGGVVGVTEVFDLMAGDELHGVKFFTAISLLGLAGVAGARASDTLQIGTSPGYTELYSPYGHEIRPENWPLRSVAAVHEDSSRVFGVDTLLVAGTDYELRNEWSELRSIARLSGGDYTSWSGGEWVVKARLSAGYRTQAEVPAPIKGVCLELAKWYFQHSEKEQAGLSSVSDGLGSRSFSGPPILTDGMLADLSGYKRREFLPTARRAWVEAA